MTESEQKFSENLDLTHTGDVMASKEQEGLDRQKPPVNLNHDGIEKAAQEMFNQVRQTHKYDSEAGMHREAGILLPKVADEKKRIELINKIIESPQDDPAEQMETFLANYEN